MRVELTGLDRPEAHPPEAVRDAAGQFEALLVAEMLKSARGERGWFGAEDQAGTSMLEIAEQHLAGLISANGGLGLADLVMAGLSRSTPGPSAPARAAEARTPASPPEGL